MEITTLDVQGIMPAMHAMRNPMNSWDRSDTQILLKKDDSLVSEFMLFRIFDPEKVVVGENDKTLSMKLQKAGPEHCKHLRMIMCWADIEAPRYWWQEFDTYRYGVEKVSCSTMHKLTSRELTEDDFEVEKDNAWAYNHMRLVKHALNTMIDEYKKEEDPKEKEELWRNLIQNLPQSYIQKRTVMMSYAALRNIVRQREGHKLREWAAFIRWAHTLPESWMIFDE
jgi:hypothetical protein